MVAQQGATPLKEELEQGACQNPHGFGFAIIVGDKIISERTMKAERSIERFLKIRKEYPEGYALWHARIATHGAHNEANCHPFKVGNDPRTYLGHNGVLSIPMYEKDPRSDSRVFAEEVLPALGGVTALDNPAIFTIVEDWAKWNKLAILTVDPEAERQVYIINEKAGKMDENGVWWSNQTHIKPKVYTDEGSSSYGHSSWGGSQTNPKNFYLAHGWSSETQGYVLKEGWVLDTDGKEYFYEGPAEPGKALALVGEVIDPEEPEFEDFINCPLCGEETDLGFDEDFCLFCNRCFGCGEKRFLCMCYNTSAWSMQTGY